MSQNAAKNSGRRPKQRVSYKSKPVQQRIVALHISGESNRKIAITEGIDRGTVGRIVSHGKLVQQIAQCQLRLFDLVPAAIREVESALSSADQRIRMRAAIKVLEGIGVLNRGGIEQSIENASRASSATHGNERIRGVLGQIVEMTIQKHQTHDIPLPDEMVRLLPSAETTVEVDKKQVTTFYRFEDGNGG
jgi:hypothetical protein